MSLLKNPRILIWIFFVVVSIILIGPNINPDGYVIKHIDRDVEVEGLEKLTTNDIIYSINGNKNVADAMLMNYTGLITLETNHGKILLRANNTEIGLNV